jgi:probable F420-dependent oxidoreductase
MKIGVDAESNDSTVPVAELARAVEDAGLDSLFFIQRTHLTVSRRELLEQEGHEMDANLLDPFIALGAAAAVTSRIELGTGACYVAVYDPLILARQVATLDQISGGRFLFGITPGWDEHEIRSHGVDPALRWQVMREKALALKALWTEPEAEFHGRFVDFDPLWMWPKPAQLPTPPILVAGFGPKVFDRVLELGDGWHASTLHLDGAELRSRTEEMNRRTDDVGRPRLPITLQLARADPRALDEYRAMGIDRCIFRLTPGSPPEVLEQVDGLRRLVRSWEG